MTNEITIDAEALELQLPEDRRIHLRGSGDLVVVARKLGKPVIREVVYREPGEAGSELAGRGKHILAVYDCFWVYYCEVEEEKPVQKEAPRP